MKVRSNQIMNKYASRLAYDFISHPVDLPQDLVSLIDRELDPQNHHSILNPSNFLHTPKEVSDVDKCQAESFSTKFHTSDYVETEDEIEYLKLALECGKRIASGLTERFPDRRCRIIVSFYETTFLENGEPDLYGTGVVRFYHIREGSDNLMRINDLNKFKVEAVLEIETGPGC